MKMKFLFSAFFAVAGFLYCQSGSITNTLGSGGSLLVKDGSTTFLTLSQTNGLLSLNNSVSIPYTTNSSVGVIYKGADRFIHNYQAPGTSGYNTFIGIASGNFTMSGSNNQEASNNTAVGFQALTSLTQGYQNLAFGNGSQFFDDVGYANCTFGLVSMLNNKTGNNNCAFGNQSLLNSNTNYNCAFGNYSIYSNITGKENSAFGYQSLYTNNSDFNTAFGSYSLYSNSSGYSNSAFGWNTLRNSLGIGNTSLGTESFYNLTNGDYNTAVGYFSGHDLSSGSNNITIGYNAQVPNGTGSNQIRLGNGSITYAGIQVAWTVTSDRRWKENIQHSNLGLNFITQLNPVSYTRKNDETHKIEYGLIAQEVEEALKSEGIENTGMLNLTDEGLYELRYNDLLAPMIKAIQELNNKNEQLKILNAELRNQNQIFEERLTKFERTQSTLVKKLDQIESNKEFSQGQFVNTEIK